MDLALINLAFMISYWLRYTAEIGAEVPEESFITLGEYLPLQIMISVILLLAFIIGGLYRKPLQSGFLDDVVVLLSTTSVGMMLVLAGIFLFQRYAWSRLMFIFIWALAILLLCAWRLFRRRVIIALYHRGIGVRRAIVVGSNPISLMVMHLMSTDVGLGYKLLGFVTDGEVQDLGRFRCLGVVEDVADIIQSLAIDEVLIAVPPANHREIFEIAAREDSSSVTFKVVPDVYELSLRQVSIDDLRGVPLIGLKEVSISGEGRFLKRALDVAVSVGALSLFSPLWLLIALAIKIDSPGPVLFRQTRVGRGGREFMIYKFRSMRQDAEVERDALRDLNEAEGGIFKIRADPRRTRSGRIIRRLSLDEIPQLINVFKGDMSLVGPRPLIPEEVNRKEEWHRKRLQVQPGMTGLWQVSGRSDLPFDEMVLLDIYYIENWSISLDLKIMIRTVPAVLSGRGAY